jgi:hypothetical protein
MSDPFQCAGQLFDAVDDAYRDHVMSSASIADLVGDLKESLGVSRYAHLIGPLGLLERHISEWHDLDYLNKVEVREWMVAWRVILGECQRLLCRHLAGPLH